MIWRKSKKAADAYRHRRAFALAKISTNLNEKLRLILAVQKLDPQGLSELHPEQSQTRT